MTRFEPEAERRLEGYLHDVAASMRAAGHDAADVDEVTDNLRDQVEEMICGAHREDVAATLADVERALARLDEPGSFASAPAPSSAPLVASEMTAPFSSAGWLGLAAALFAVGGIALSLAVGALSPADEDLPGAILLVTQLVALVAGAMSRRSRAGRFGLVCALVLLGMIAVLAIFGGA